MTVKFAIVLPLSQILKLVHVRYHYVGYYKKFSILQTNNCLIPVCWSWIVFAFGVAGISNKSSSFRFWTIQDSILNSILSTPYLWGSSWVCQLTFAWMYCTFSFCFKFVHNYSFILLSRLIFLKQPFLWLSPTSTLAPSKYVWFYYTTGW